LTSPTWIDLSVHAWRLGIQRGKEQAQQIQLMMFEKRIDNFWLRNTRILVRMAEKGTMAKKALGKK
jgi:hypothetical protein